MITTALITGSNGFIGQHLTQELVKRGIKVTGFSRKLNKNIVDYQDFVDLPAVDVVFHLAAVSGYKSADDNTSLAYQVNVVGTVNVLEYCRKVKAKLIFPSTYVYDAPYTEFKKESDPVKPTTHYSFTKWIGEKLCRFYSRVYQLDTLILRTANVYGAGQELLYIVPLVAKHLLENKELTLTKPDIERGFIYIDDLVEVYLKLAEAETLPGDTFNVGPNRPIQLQELVRIIAQLSNTVPKISYTNQDRPNEVPKNRLDISKIKKAINWHPRVSIEEGLGRYLTTLVNQGTEAKR